jgi:sugar phosphate permease
VTSGIVNTCHEFGAAIGVAVVSSIAASSLTGGGQDSSGFTTAFTFAAVLAGVGALVSLTLVPGGRPAPGAVAPMH